MARPIKDTPVLTGKDAINFELEVKKNEGKKVDPKVRERIRQNYLKFKSIERF